MFLTKKKQSEINVETKPLKVRGKLKLEFSYIGLPNSYFKMDIFECMWPPIQQQFENARL